MRDLFASDDAWRSHEARAIGDDSDAAKQEASPLLRDTPGKVRLWIDALTDADLEGQHRLFHLIAESPEWAALVPALRIAVVGAIRGRSQISMATAILGKFDDRTLAWRDPPGEAWTRPNPTWCPWRPSWRSAGPVRGGRGAGSRSGARWDLSGGRRRQEKRRFGGGGGARESRPTVGWTPHRAGDRVGRL